MNVSVKPHHFLVDQNGKPDAVVLSFSSYQRLVQLIEDLKDAADLKRAIRTSGATISHSELIQRLKRKHLI